MTTRPDPVLRPIVKDGAAAHHFAQCGATQEADRRTPCGVWLGRDFYNDDGRLVGQSVVGFPTSGGMP